MANQDEQHLKLIEILYYVVGGFAGLFALVPIIHLFIGIMILKGSFPIEEGGQPAPAFLGWLFIGIASALMVFGSTLCVLMILTGRFMAKRKRYLFCFVISAASCLFMPLGTILGIFSIIVLSRPSVKALFTASV